MVSSRGLPLGSRQSRGYVTGSEQTHPRIEPACSPVCWPHALPQPVRQRGSRPVLCDHASSLERCRIALSTSPDTVDAIPRRARDPMNLSAPSSTNSFPKTSSAKLLEIKGTSEKSTTILWLGFISMRFFSFVLSGAPARREPNESTSSFNRTSKTLSPVSVSNRAST